MKLFFSFSIAAFVLSIFFPMQAWAASFGASPSRIINERLLQGSSFEQEIVISRDSTEGTTTYYISTTGEAASYLSLDLPESSQVVLEDGEQSKSITAAISIPEELSRGQYEGLILIQEFDTKKTTEEVIEESVATTVPAVAIALDFSVQHREYSEYTINNIQTQTTAVSHPIPVFYDIDSIGNQHARPDSLSVTVTDLDHEETYLYEVQDVVHPSVPQFTYKLFHTPIQHELEVGTYWLHVAVIGNEGEQQDTRTLSLEIIDEQEELEKGEITSLSFDEAVRDDGIGVTVSSVFDNATDDFIPLTFDIIAETEGGLVGGQLSVPYAAGPYEQVEMEQVLVIQEEGRYNITATVSYPGGEEHTSTYSIRVGDSNILTKLAEGNTEDVNTTQVGVLILVLLLVVSIMVGGYVARPKKTVTKPVVEKKKTDSKKKESKKDQETKKEDKKKA